MEDLGIDTISTSPENDENKIPVARIDDIIFSSHPNNRKYSMRDLYQACKTVLHQNHERRLGVLRNRKEGIAASTTLEIIGIQEDSLSLKLNHYETRDERAEPERFSEYFEMDSTVRNPTWETYIAKLFNSGESYEKTLETLARTFDANTEICSVNMPGFDYIVRGDIFIPVISVKDDVLKIDIAGSKSLLGDIIKTDTVTLEYNDRVTIKGKPEDIVILKEGSTRGFGVVKPLDHGFKTYKTGRRLHIYSNNKLITPGFDKIEYYGTWGDINQYSAVFKGKHFDIRIK